MNVPMQQPITLSLENSTGLSCEVCGGVFFKHDFVLRRWSKLLIGTPEDHIEPIPCFRCSDCGSPLKQFFPKGMKDIEEMFGLEEKETKKTIIGG